MEGVFFVVLVEHMEAHACKGLFHSHNYQKDKHHVLKGTRHLPLY